MKTRLFSIFLSAVIILSDINAQNVIGETWNVTTIAGWEEDNKTMDGQGQKAHFTWRMGSSAIDINDNYYVIDEVCLRKMDINLNVSTLFGSGAMDGDYNALDIGPLVGQDGICIDKNGNIYVSSCRDHAIYRIKPDKTVELYAGKEGYKGKNDGNRLEAEFYGPTGLCFDNSGNMYVADTYNGSVRKIGIDGKVTTLAGNGEIGDFKPGLGKDAQFGEVRAIAVDSKGNVFVSQNGGRGTCVARISPTGVVSNFVGDIDAILPSGNSHDGVGKAARFMRINALVVDKDDNLIIGETNRVRKVSQDGLVTTLAGSIDKDWRDDVGTKAGFRNITGLSIDSKGNIFVSDQFCVRKMTKL